MGYTHSWEILDPEAWSVAFPLIVHDAHIIISHSEVSVEGPAGEWREPAAPTVSETEGIYLNGWSDSHEPFILVPNIRTIPLDRKGRAGYRRFCKTARKPYDLVVTAILLRAKVHAGDALRVSSDGSWSEWMEARYFVKNLWGKEGVVRTLYIDEDREAEDEYEDEDELEWNLDGNATSEGTVTDDEGASLARDDYGIELKWNLNGNAASEGTVTVDEGAPLARDDYGTESAEFPSPSSQLVNRL